MKQRQVQLPVHNRLIVGLVMLACVLSLGTAGFMVTEGWPFLDAFYMTVTTVTTVGFQEVHQLDTAGRIFTILLVLFGVGVAFYILTVMVAAIIEGDLSEIFGSRRMRMTIEKLQDHCIICGYGRVGEEVAKELQARGSPIVVIDRVEDALARARNDGLLVVQGDATSEAALLSAGIERCRALIAASDSDAANTFITLTAKGLRADVFVVARISTPDVEAKLRQAGAGRVVSPYSIGGRRMALAAVQPALMDFIDMPPTDSQKDRMLAELEVDEASGLAGRELREALADRPEVVVLAVRNRSGALTVGPPSSTVLYPGDQLMVVGSEGDLRTLGAVKRR